jgi:hypothetical protein
MRPAPTIEQALMTAMGDTQGLGFVRTRLKLAVSASKKAVADRDRPVQFMRALAFAWLDAPDVHARAIACEAMRQWVKVAGLLRDGEAA